MAAFWWLSLAVYAHLSVGLLAQLIEQWYEWYESALLWWYGVRWFDIPEGQRPVPQDRYDWAVWADLRHSSSLGLDPRPHQDRFAALIGKAVIMMTDAAPEEVLLEVTDNFALPSQLQRWAQPPAAGSTADA